MKMIILVGGFEKPPQLEKEKLTGIHSRMDPLKLTSASPKGFSVGCFSM